MINLEKTIKIACEAHEGQTDKCGLPYVLHPIRVMMKMPWKDSKLQKIAILHDVVEDTYITMGQIESAGFEIDVVQTVDYLSRRKNEIYKEYIERLKCNKFAIIVKMADIEDNCDLRRITDKSAGLIAKRYIKTYMELKDIGEKSADRCKMKEEKNG